MPRNRPEELNLTVFRNNLASLLDSHAQSALELSQEIHTSPSTMSRYLAGVRAPDIECAVKICSYYGVSLDWLLGLNPTSKTSKFSETVNHFAELYSLATDQDRTVIDTILNRYEDVNREYLSVQAFSDQFCEIGKHDPIEVNAIIKALSEVDKLYPRLSNVELSYRFSSDRWADASLLSFNIQFNRAVIYFAPKRIQIYLTSHDIFPNEINPLLDGLLPFLNPDLGKSEPYKDLSYFYYLDPHKIYAGLDEFLSVVKEFINEINEG